MNSAGKTAIAALCINLAAYCPALADSAAAPGAQIDADRLQTLLKTIDEQNQKLERQQADIDRQRSELENQKVELLKLKAAITGSPALASKASSPSAAQANRTAHAVPRGAESDAVASGAPANDRATATAQNTAYDGRSQLVGSTAKNDLGIPAPGRETAVAANNSPYDADGNIHVHTLKDLVRSAIAPTLSGESEVGEKPKKETPAIDIAVLADRGGVLTPRGALVFTPTVEYSHSSVNRFFFDGVELADAFNIGNLLAENIDRESVTSTFAFRYGVTRRLEVDAQVPFLYRDDKTFNNVFISNIGNTVTELTGDSVGDVEFGAHYQLNKPKGPYPYFVAGVRAKSTTGIGPYDVPFDLQAGLPLKLPTGSGFWTVEPQFTMIYPSDPVVLFANVGYQYTFSKNVNKIIQDTLKTPNTAIFPNTQEENRLTVTDVSPGGAVDISLGMGIGLNDSVSMSFGYQHSWILGTDTHTRSDVLLNVLAPGSGSSITGSTTAVSHSQDAQLGQLLIGASVAVDNNVGLNFNVAIGVTDTAPDVTVTFRTPLTWRLFH
ncbi:MAG: hypothetical protein WAW96_17835 [Alphaproteobacteria bacterium]